MKQHIAALILLLALTAASSAQQPQQAITKENARTAIATFRQEPLSERGREAASIILRFAKESPDVAVAFSPLAMPWLNSKPSPNHSDALLAAYMTGTIRSQLDKGVAMNDPVAGAEQVIETYQFLQKTDPSFHVPGVEKLVELKASGKLKEFVGVK